MQEAYVNEGLFSKLDERNSGKLYCITTVITVVANA